ncbi:MAG TPA: palindromic element RPE4 domain-containing protein [Rickettsia endosymbiont of Bembidion nr. Transversale]|nr:palindromic element RPE4 domain-containing protein [Rickettsia endosymbiont of Bembidion nr. Transversale]
MIFLDTVDKPRYDPVLFLD